MKNLNKKIGASLAALAFFTTVGFVSKNAWAVKPNPLYILGASEEKNVTKKDSDVMKVVETLKKTTYKNSYQTSEKIISFGYSDKSVSKDKREFLELRIYKLDKNGEYVTDSHVVIKDYNMDNLDSQDVIQYFEKTRYDYPDWGCTESIKFGELSSKTQQEIREKYSKIIKEAPEKLLKEDEAFKQNLKLQEEQKKQRLEHDILDTIK